VKEKGRRFNTLLNNQLQDEKARHTEANQYKAGKDGE
jgi:hypothetical protein